MAVIVNVSSEEKTQLSNLRVERSTLQV